MNLFPLDFLSQSSSNPYRVGLQSYLLKTAVLTSEKLQSYPGMTIKIPNCFT